MGPTHTESVKVSPSIYPGSTSPTFAAMSLRTKCVSGGVMRVRPSTEARNPKE